MIWLLAGVALLVGEIVIPGVFLVWLGVAALGTGAATLAAGLTLGLEVPLFALLAALAVLAGWRMQRPRHPVLNTPQSGLVGRSAVALAFEGREGRVRVGDSDWPARLAAGANSSDSLQVVAVEGTTLVVGTGDSGPASKQHRRL